MIEDDPLIKQAISEIGEPPPRPRRYWLSKAQRLPTAAAIKYDRELLRWECAVIERAKVLRDRNHPAPPAEQEAQR